MLKFIPFLAMVYMCLGPRVLSAQVAATDILPTHELNHRIALATQRLLDTTPGVHRPAFTHEFILADVDLDPDRPRRFDNFSGDLSGRYIEVISLLEERDPQPARRENLSVLVNRLLIHQHPDGRFGKPDLRYVADEISGEHMAQLWGNGRLLVGLMTYHGLTDDARVLAAARRLGDFFMTTTEQARRPEIATRLRGLGAQGIICFSQYAEGLAMLYAATEDEHYAAAAEAAYTALPPRDEVHTHGYLSTLRGAMLLHGLTGQDRHLTFVRDFFDDLLVSDDYTRYGAVWEYFGGKGERDEGCSSADFVRLAYQLHTYTGEERYLDAAEFGLLNALLNNQHTNGDFGNHFFEEFGIKASNPRRAWWCCTMHGLRALLEVKRRSLNVEAGGRILQTLMTQRYAKDGYAFSLTHAGSEGGTVVYSLTIDEWAGGHLRLREPLRTDLRVNDEDGLLFIPTAGMTYRLRAGYEMRLQGHDGAATDGPPAGEIGGGVLFYGPYVMGINEQHFTAEPDWGHQVNWSKLHPGELPLSLSTTFRPGGYPGEHEVTFMPVAHQMYFGHPYMRVTTRYAAR